MFTTALLDCNGLLDFTDKSHESIQEEAQSNRTLTAVIWS